MARTSRLSVCSLTGPRLGQRSQAGLGLADSLGNIEKIARRSGEAIEPRHRHHVAGLQMVQHLRQLGAAAMRAGCLFLKDALAACRFQLRALLVKGLAVGRDARISDHHGAGGFRCYAHRPNLAGASRRENPYSATVAGFGTSATMGHLGCLTFRSESIPKLQRLI